MTMEKRQLVDTIMLAIDGALADLHTATVAKVTRVSTETISCQPVTNRIVRGESIPLPEFVEVPPVFLQGGGSYTAHPIAIGDYCLLIFTERCFDRWYHGQDFLIPLELRMHDYSDGFALVGVNPLAGAITIPSVIQQTGDTNYDGDHTHQGTLDRVGDTTIEGDVEIDGNLLVTGNITCLGTIAAANFTGLSGGAMTATVNIETSQDVKAGSISLQSHTHTGVTPGTGSSGGPQ